MNSIDYSTKFDYILAGGYLETKLTYTANLDELTEYCPDDTMCNGDTLYLPYGASPNTKKGLLILADHSASADNYKRRSHLLIEGKSNENAWVEAVTIMNGDLSDADGFDSDRFKYTDFDATVDTYLAVLIQLDDDSGTITPYIVIFSLGKGMEDSDVRTLWTDFQIQTTTDARGR